MSLTQRRSVRQLYRLLDQLQVAHMEMAGLVRDYIQLLEDLEERRDPDKLALARILPGAQISESRPPSSVRTG